MNSSIPPPRPEEAGIKPMSSLAAGLWTLAVTFGVLLFIGMWAERSGYFPWEIARAGCQTAVYSLTLYTLYQRYADGSGVGRFFALRGTSVGYYGIAIVFGLAMSLWLNTTFNVLLSKFPLGIGPLEDDDHIQRATVLWKVGFGLAYVAVGPFIEEAFFRGALFGCLRKSQPALNTVVIVALLFAMAHIRWQIGVPLFFLAMVMCLLRQWSGSLIPSLLVHMCFNGVAFATEIVPRWNEAFERYTSLGFAHGAVVVGSMAVSGLCIFGAYVISSAPSAVRARTLDA
jgi:membrane protease YdiL (CAAX protease family)